MKFGMLSLLDYYPEDKSEEQYYKDFFAEVDLAEELGFDAMWIGEHHFCNYVCPSPQIVAMAIAQRTKKMRIGTAVALLPHHDPIRLAEDYAMLDLLSGGRLDFGVGRGFIKLIYDGFNQSMDESRERFREVLEVIEQAWSRETFSYQGQFYTADMRSSCCRAPCKSRCRPSIWPLRRVENLSSPLGRRATRCYWLCSPCRSARSKKTCSSTVRR